MVFISGVEILRLLDLNMLNVFGKEYEEYKKHTLKYLGRK